MVSLDPPRSPDGLPRVERFFDALLTRDGAGGSWLAPLLAATPRGEDRLGELARTPGWLEATVAVRTETGRRGAFEYPAAPSPGLLGWLIDHPDELDRPQDDGATAEAVRLRRALLDDDPPGARPRAQERAHRLLGEATGLGSAWWRLEQTHRCDCVLITDRLVVLARDGDRERPATPWLTRRSDRVRDLEAAERLAQTTPGGPKAWATLTLVTGAPDAAGAGARLEQAVLDGAPHLDAAGRAALVDGDLGDLSWDRAAAVTGLPAAPLQDL